MIGRFAAKTVFSSLAGNARLQCTVASSMPQSRLTPEHERAFKLRPKVTKVFWFFFSKKNNPYQPFMLVMHSHHSANRTPARKLGPGKAYPLAGSYLASFRFLP